jgi:hypothetical protein
MFGLLTEEAQTLMVGSTAQVDDEAADYETDDQHYFQGGEYHFGLCIRVSARSKNLSRPTAFR